MSVVPKALLARAFLLIVVLILLSFATSVAIFRHAVQKPRAQQMAQLVVTAVNLTRAAVLSSAPEWRSALLAELRDVEGLRVQMADTTDVLEPMRAQSPELLMMMDMARDRLGEATRFAVRRNDEEAFWVSFFIGREEFWVALPRERIEHPLSEVLLVWGGVALLLALLGAYFIARQVAQPLNTLAQAAQQIGRGGMPHPLPERGAKEIVTVSRAFNQMSADLAASDRERALVLAGISHDLRTPLARMRLAAEMSADEMLREGLIADVEQMDAVIQQFLDYARLDENAQNEASNLRPNGVAVLTDMQLLVQEAVQPFKATVRSLSLDLQPMPPIFVKPLFLKRALANLMDNAIKYGGGEITVQCRQDGEQVVLAVADRGRGIPAEQREAVKRPFVRLEKARSNATGSGLGLAIVERAARLHGGNLFLEARAGGGLEARLVFPHA